MSPSTAAEAERGKALIAAAEAAVRRKSRRVGREGIREF
jgi:hypothetical protein